MHSARRPRPQQRGCGDREHGERHRLARIVALPCDHIDDHQHDPDHRAADQQERAAIVPSARQQRRIEGVEHRASAGEDRDGRHDGAEQTDHEADPRSGHAANGTTQACRRHRIAKTHREERGHAHRPSPCRAGDRRVIGDRIVERRRQRAAHQHLPGAQHHSRQQTGRRPPNSETGPSDLLLCTARPFVRASTCGNCSIGTTMTCAHMA